MQIHIGNIIRDELRRQGLTNAWLADRIGCTPRTLQKLFHKPSLDSQQLYVISRALGTDLFRHYSLLLSATPPRINLLKNRYLKPIKPIPDSTQLSQRTIIFKYSSEYFFISAKYI